PSNNSPRTELPVATAQPKLLLRPRWETPLESTAPPLEAGWTGTTALWTLDNGKWAQVLLNPKDEEIKKPQPIWRPVPFWNASWGGYAGARRPDSSLAKQMDALLESAASENKSQPLAILDGGALERQGVFNWASHPLRARLAGPGELF